MAKNVIDVLITASDTGLRKGLASADKELGRFQDRVSKMGANMRRFGSTMSLGVTLPIVAGFALATKAAVEEEQEQAKLAQTMRKTVGATNEQVAATEEWITATQNATGVADSELRPALGKLLIGGRSVAQAQRDLAVAMDIAAARGKPLGTVIEGMSKAAIGNTGALGRMGIVTKDAAGNALSYDEILKNASATMGGAAAANANTAAGRMERLKLMFQDLVEEIGAVFIPILEKLVRWIGKAADWFSNLDGSTKTLIVGAGLLAAAIGPIVFILGALLTPVGLVIAAIAALAGGIYYAYQNSETFRNAVDQVAIWLRDVFWPAVQEVFGALLAWFREHWPEIQEAVTHAINVIRAAVEAWLVGFRKFWNTWGDEIVDTIKNTVNTIKNVIEFFLAIINGDWGKAWNKLKDLVGNVLSQIRITIETFMSTIRLGWDALWAGMTAAVRKARGLIESIVNGIKGVLKAIWNPIADVLNAIRIAIPKVHIKGTNVDLGGGSFDPFDLPKLHGGGVFRSSGGEGLALLRNNEVVFTPEQMEALRGAGGITVNVTSPADPRAIADELGWLLRTA